jgi:tryptophanyl-tRNA synthetase
MAIDYRDLGCTGVKVSPLCLGAMMFGAWGNTDHEDSISIIHRALDAGINFIDTADVYSRGESEEIVGKALAGGRRDSVVLATKIHGRMGDDPNQFGNSRRWIIQEVENSLRRLGTDWIDLYQIHRPEPDTDIDETLGALPDLVTAGKVRYIGSSTFPAHAVVQAQWVAERRGRERFVCEQPPYSMLIRGIEADLLPVCRQYGMGVITWSPLAGGWLSGRYGRGGDSPASSRRAQMLPTRYDMSLPGNQRKLEAAQALGEVAEQAGLTLLEMALAFVTGHPAVTSAIIGPRTAEHLEGQLAALELTLDPDVLDRIDARCQREPDRPRLGCAVTDRCVAEAAPASRLSAVRVFSGIQPTGRKHLGNYIGAISQYVAAQERGESIFCIVDLHAITVAYDPVELRERLYDTLATLLAAGLDPARCTLFRQSDVAEHTELTWLLSSVTELGRLQRMHQFRDKSIAQRELVSSGLLMYPVLQSADVLAYRAQEVPVGEDQREHLELMRDVARRFNARFGDGEEILVVPEHRSPPVGARIMDLQDPTRKMSTTGGSEQGTVHVLDEERVIEKKLKSAVTDSGSEVRRAPEKPGVSNLIEILAAVRELSAEEIEREFQSARYGELKGATATAVVEYLRPVRERYTELRADQAGLEAILQEGAAGARAIAAETLSDVRERMGVGPPRSGPVGGAR